MEPDDIDAVLSALADPIRRRIVERLGKGEATVTDLSAPFDVSGPAISRHLTVLESAGLVVKGRRAQWRPCRLATEPLRAVDDWMDDYRRFFTDRFDRLAEHLSKETP